VSKAAAKGAVLVGCGSPKKTVIYFPWAMKLAEFWDNFLALDGVLVRHAQALVEGREP